MLLWSASDDGAQWLLLRVISKLPVNGWPSRTDFYDDPVECWFIPPQPPPPPPTKVPECVRGAWHTE